MKYVCATLGLMVWIVSAHAQEPASLNLDEKSEMLWVEVSGLYDQIPMDHDILEIQRQRLMAYTNAYFFLANPPKTPKELAKEKDILEAYRKIQKRRYEPVIRELAKRVHEDNVAFKLKFLKESKLTEADVDAIIAAVEATDLMVDKHILSIKVSDLSNVEVRTGFVKGPLYGGGNILTLRKDKEQWKVVKKSGWVS